MNWEYRTLSSYAPLDDWPEGLDSLGMEGWELVSAFVVQRGVHEDQAYTLAMAVFKRRIEETGLGEIAHALGAAQGSEEEITDALRVMEDAGLISIDESKQEGDE